MLKAMMILAGCVLWLATATAEERPYTDKEHQDIVRNYMDGVRREGDGPWPSGNQYSRFEVSRLIPLLTPYRTDSNWHVRLAAVRRLGYFGKHDQNVMRLLGKSLDDANWNVRRAACGALCRVEKREFILQKNELAPQLLKFARRVDDGHAINAIELIADLEGAAAIAKIKDLRRRLATPGYAYEVSKKVVSKQLITLIDDGCRSVLAKLGDHDAAKEIIGLLGSDGVRDRIRGIDQVKYVGRQMGSELLPLLGDRRDGLRVGPAGDTWMLRVCDVAAVALVGIYELKTSFGKFNVLMAPQHSDAQIAEVKKLVEAEIAKKH